MQVALNTDEVEFITAWRMYRSGDVSLSPATHEFLTVNLNGTVLRGSHEGREDSRQGLAGVGSL
jgi:hypothetical protein